MRIRFILAVLVVTAVAPAFAATVYTDEATFLADLSGPYFLEDFNGYTYGSYQQPTLDLGPDVNGYACTISATTDILYSGNGNMSTNLAGDALEIAFTGTAVYSTGGFFFAGDISGNYIANECTVTLSDGTSDTFSPPSDTTFRGYIAAVPLTTMSIDCPDTTANAWPTMDHFYMGPALIPVELQSFTIE